MPDLINGCWQQCREPPVPLWYYGLVVVLVGLALVLTMRVAPFREIPTALLFMAVFISAVCGGWRLGLLALGLAALGGAYFILPPSYSLVIGWHGAMEIGVFVVGSFVYVLLLYYGQRTRAMLLVQREWLRVMLASIGDAVVATDTHTRVRLSNRAAQQLTGWTQEDACGRPVTEIFRIIHPETRQPLAIPVDRIIHEGITVELPPHMLLVARDGSERLIEDSSAPIRDEQGNILGAVLVFHDVSDKRRAEQQRDAQRLLMEELAQLNAQLLHSNAELDAFAYTASHDLQEPLRGMQYSVRFLIEDYGEKLDVEGTARLQTLLHIAQRMEALINSLMYYSHLDRAELVLCATDVNLVVREALELLAACFEVSGVQIRLPGSLPTVRADRVQLCSATPSNTMTKLRSGWRLACRRRHSLRRRPYSMCAIMVLG